MTSRKAGFDLPAIGFVFRRVSEFRNSEAGGYKFYPLYVKRKKVLQEKELMRSRMLSGYIKDLG